MATVTRPLETEDRISLNDVAWVDRERMSGQPCFTGTRVPIQSFFDYLEDGETLGEFLDDFPGVSREQAVGALHFGKERLLDESAEP